MEVPPRLGQFRHCPSLLGRLEPTPLFNHFGLSAIETIHPFA